MDAGAAWCAVHPDRVSVGSCEHCGAFSCADCLGELGGRLICRSCATEGRYQGELPPWERRAELGLMPAILQTIQQVSFDPVRFFARLAPGGRLGDVLPLLLLLGIVQGLVGGFNTFLFGAAMQRLIGSTPQETGMEALDLLLGSTGQAVATVIVTPISNVVGPFLLGATVHLGLLVFGAARKPIDTTIRAVAYVYVLGIWGAIPVVGYLTGLIAGLWLLVVTVIAAKEVHGTTWGRALGGVLLFPCGCTCLIAGGAAVIAAIAAGAA